jgi:hypothetical protein
MGRQYSVERNIAPYMANGVNFLLCLARRAGIMGGEIKGYRVEAKQRVRLMLEKNKEGKELL